MRQFTEHDLEIAARLLEISPLYLPIFERVEAGLAEAMNNPLARAKAIVARTTKTACAV